LHPLSQRYVFILDQIIILEITSKLTESSSVHPIACDIIRAN
jgi:hypothetical protein